MKPSRQQRIAAVDWDAARARLGAAERAMATALSVSPEQAQAVLDERARRLAQVGDAPARPQEQVEVVTFILSNEQYAIETRSVREVVKFSDFTPVPSTSALFRGLRNLRGEILAIFDLRELFGLETRTISDLFRIIIVGSERPDFGMVADAVGEVLMLPVSELAHPASVAADRPYLRGVTKDALIVLDGAALLADRRLYVDDSLGV